MTKKNISFLIAGAFMLALVASLSGMWMYKTFLEGPKYVTFSEGPVAPTFSKYTEDAPTAEVVSFVQAAKVSRPAVVHIKSRYAMRRTSKNSDFFSNPFREFFDEGERGDMPQGMASGSGVIISKDGYIATNNHVIEDADELEVTLFDNRTFTAEVIGFDPNTDLALLKIDGDDLPSLPIGNSDKVRVGEWVLAVGNPMDLTSTVTAGIVSAKGRNINLLQGDTESNLTIESFIQTDAAVNRGNSGGALVNTDGELVGINTAIASRTGSYAGYSFAIPATLVKKVMEDLLAYGEVRRGFLGITIQPVNARLAEDQDLGILKGAYVSSVSRESGAFDAGIKPGDVITKVNGNPVSNTSELQEQVSRFRPGDKVGVTLFRNRQKREYSVRLKNQFDNKSISSNSLPGRNSIELKGSSFRVLTPKEKNDLGISNGIKVESASSSLKRGGVQDGFVITEINSEKLFSIEQLEKVIDDSGDYVTIKGLLNKGMIASYSFSW